MKQLSKIASKLVGYVGIMGSWVFMWVCCAVEGYLPYFLGAGIVSCVISTFLRPNLYFSGLFHHLLVKKVEEKVEEGKL